MFLSPRVFYAEDASGSGSGGTDVLDLVVKDPLLQTQVTPTPILTEAQMKEYGFETPEQLTDYLKRKKDSDIPEAEKKKQEASEQANLIKYATDNDIAKPEDFNQYESLKAKADRDLVFEQFASQFKEDNPEIAPEDLDAEIKNAFEAEYKLTSANPKAKARGESRLGKEAGEIRNPVNSKIQKAQEDYNYNKSIQAKGPAFNKFISDLVAESVPETLVVYKGKDGEEDIVVDIKFTKEERDAIAKTFHNEKTFYDFTKSKDVATVKTKIAKKIDSYIKANKFDAAIKEVWEKGFGLGTRKGSNTGADNPFALTDKSGEAVTGKTSDTQAASNASAAREKYRNGR